MRPVDRPIAIAGAGIGGLTLANGLQARGFDVVVLERQGEIRDQGAGISLWPNALGALDRLGLGEEVRDAGVPFSEGGLRRMDGRDGLRFSSDRFLAALGSPLVCVDRGALVRVLAGRLASGRLRMSSAVTGFRRSSGSMVVTLDHGEELEVAALVAADGITSIVASQINGGLRFSYSGYLAWRGIANFVFEADARQIRACLAGGHEFGWMPVSDSETYWFATACLPEHFHPLAGDHDYLGELFAAWPDPVPELELLTPANRMVRTAIVDRDRLRRWTDGRVALLGDAAHPMRPHLGQGGCQAVEDAAALATALLEAPDVTEAFVLYEQLRRRRAERIVRLSRHTGFTRSRGLATTAFDHLPGRLPALPVGRALRLLRPIAGYESAPL